MHNVVQEQYLAKIPNLKHKWIMEKNSYEPHAYESVDDKSLVLDYISKIEEKNSCNVELNQFICHMVQSKLYSGQAVALSI